MPDPVYGEEAVIFAALRPGAAVDAETIRTHCAGLLADFKVPKRVIFLDGIPKNERGKIDRAALVALWDRDFAD